MYTKKILTIILAGGKGERLDPLTRDRTKPAVPFGGIYRIIDFTLSNAINSHLRKIIVLVQYKCVSLNRHLRDGWSFLSSSMGEYIEPIPPQQRVKNSWYLGTADAVYQNLYSIEKEHPDYVIILAGDHIYKMNYLEMLKYHIDHKSSITVGVVPVPKNEAHLYGIVAVDSKNHLIDFREKPKNQLNLLPTSFNAHPDEPPDTYLASMGIYIFNTAVLYEAVTADDKIADSTHDFGHDILPNVVHHHKYETLAFKFIDEQTHQPKYWRDVGTIDAYYQANMDLVSVSPVFNLYDTEWPIRAYQVQAPPPKFIFAQEEAGGRLGTALDSLICQGCIISGGRVQNSILSPNVRVNSYADISQSILFEGVQVGQGAKIKNAIIDKDVKIPEGMEIGYNLTEDCKRFTVTPSGLVVISKGEIL
ncbi:MAG: glucose-1-phosphate adenylyltransferase [Planctomycetota bacterium]